MPASRKLIRRRAGAAIAALAIAAGGTFAMRPAGAEAQSVSFSLVSGVLGVGEQSFVLPTTAGLNGTLDDETGELRGTFVFPVIESAVTEPFPVVVFAQLSQEGDAVGQVDFDTGAATLDVTLRIGLEIKTAAGATLVGGGCSIGPISLSFTGTYEASTGTLSIADEGFTLPSSSGCASPGIDFGPIIDDLLGGDTSAELVLSSSSTPITTPSTPSTQPTTATTAGPTTPSTPTTPTTPGGPANPADPARPRPATNGSQNVQPVIVDQEAGAAPEYTGTARVTG